MHKTRNSKYQKIQKILLSYPLEFNRLSNRGLWCCLCAKSLPFDKKFLIDQHRKTNKHVQNSKFTFPPSPHHALSTSNFNKDLVTTFLQLDIPLHKLRGNCFNNLLTKYKLPVLSQSSAQSMIYSIAKEKIQSIRDILKDEPVFIIVDECSIEERKYVNILMGSLIKPNHSFLTTVKCLESNVNSNVISQIVDDSVKEMNIERGNLCLLLSDAAAYMKLSGNILKSLYPNLIHITCLAHLIHNCSLKVKQSYPRVDAIIATTKTATVKNATRRNLFHTIGVPPQPVVTRWSSWLKAIRYYSSNFGEIKRIVNSFESEGKIVMKNKEAINAIGVEDDLVIIERCYMNLVDLLDKFEKKSLDVMGGYNEIATINLNEDPVGIKKYLEKRLKNNGIEEIVKDNELKGMNPYIRSLLQSAQCTSIDVERSFSMLGKMLRKDRRFKSENIQNYLICYYNKDI